MKYFSKNWWWALPLISTVFIWNYGFFGFSYGPISTPSMEPTFKSGEDWVFTNPFEKVRVGDVIEFTCFDTKCNRGVQDEMMNHRLVKTDENGCMHILGDNQSNSWDTNDYGCLMPDQLKVYGVVHKLNL